MEFVATPADLVSIQFLHDCIEMHGFNPTESSQDDIDLPSRYLGDKYIYRQADGSYNVRHATYHTVLCI